MERRKFVNAAAIFGSAAVLQACMPGGMPGPGGIPMLGSGGDGVSLGDLAERFATGAKRFAAGALKANDALVNVGKAAGWKGKSALSAGAIKQIEDGNLDGLTDVVKQSESQSDEIFKHMKDKKSYTASEKKAIGDAFGDYVQAGAAAMVSLAEVYFVFQDLGNAAPPSINDGPQVVGMIKDLKNVGPVATTYGPAYVKSVKSYVDLLKMKDIAIPERATKAAEQTSKTVTWG